MTILVILAALAIILLIRILIAAQPEPRIGPRVKTMARDIATGIGAVLLWIVKAAAIVWFCTFIYAIIISF